MADAHETRGNVVAAKTFHNQALDSAKAVQAAMPNNRDADGQVAASHRMLEQFLTRQKRFEEAPAANIASNALRQRMSERPPTKYSIASSKQ